MAYTFSFDASACTGCKACQEACKDRNGLPVGVLWRRVVEVAGGDWHKTAAGAWENSVFAYNFSLACNHCVHPKCAGVCPTDAYMVRPDGIVLLDPSRCMGCGYCAWACPYGAPQYDAGRGIMTKCDFCSENLDAGLSPSCVAACPLRVLDFDTAEVAELPRGRLNLWQLPGNVHPFPLPDYSRTEPHLSIKLHPAMSSPLEKTIANREEIQPGALVGKPHRIAVIGELPLVGFTVLTQMAVGMAVFSLVLPSVLPSILVMIGILLGAGALISFLHVGRKRNAWRSVIHLRKSWLSREVLMAILFSTAWAVTTGWQWLQKTPSARSWLMAAFGLLFLYSMSRIYRLRAVPAWNTWRTPVSFFLSAALLGTLGVRLFAAFPGWWLIAGLAVAGEIYMTIATQPPISRTPLKLRLALLALGMIGILLMTIFPQFSTSAAATLILIIALVAELVGRWQFYSERMLLPFHSN